MATGLAQTPPTAPAAHTHARGLLTPVSTNMAAPADPSPSDAGSKRDLPLFDAFSASIGPSLPVVAPSKPRQTFIGPPTPPTKLSNPQAPPEARVLYAPSTTELQRRIALLTSSKAALLKDLDTANRRAEHSRRRLVRVEEDYSDLQRDHDRVRAEREGLRTARKKAEAAAAAAEVLYNQAQKEAAAARAEADAGVRPAALLAEHAKTAEANRKTTAAVTTGRKWIARCRDFEERLKVGEEALEAEKQRYAALMAEVERVEELAPVMADADAAALRRTLLTTKTELIKTRMANQDLGTQVNRYISAEAVKHEATVHLRADKQRLEDALRDQTTTSGNKIALLNEEREKQFAELEAQLTVIEQLKIDLDARDAAVAAANAARQACETELREKQAKGTVARIADLQKAHKELAHQTERAEWYKAQCQREGATVAALRTSKAELQNEVQTWMTRAGQVQRMFHPNAQREVDGLRARVLTLEGELRRRDDHRLSPALASGSGSGPDSGSGPRGLELALVDKDRVIADLRKSLAYRMSRWHEFHSRMQRAECGLEKEKKRVRYLEGELEDVRGTAPLAKRIKMNLGEMAKDEDEDEDEDEEEEEVEEIEGRAPTAERSPSESESGSIGGGATVASSKTDEVHIKQEPLTAGHASATVADADSEDEEIEEIEERDFVPAPITPAALVSRMAGRRASSEASGTLIATPSPPPPPGNALHVRVESEGTSMGASSFDESFVTAASSSSVGATVTGTFKAEPASGSESGSGSESESKALLAALWGAMVSPKTDAGALPPASAP